MPKIDNYFSLKLEVKCENELTADLLEWLVRVTTFP